MNARSPWVLVPLVIIIGLFAAGSYLLNQNTAYARKNRELLLQNDSVLSVNLDLMNELDKLKSNRPKPEKR